MTEIYKTKINTVITALENQFQATRITQETIHHKTQVIEVDLQNKEIHEISHKIDIVDQITIRDRIQTEMFLIPVPIHTLGIVIPTIDHEIHPIIEIETNLTIGIEVTQIIVIKTIQTTDQETTHTIDQIIKDPMIIIKTDNEIIHKTEIQATTIDIEIIPNLPIGIIAVAPILNIDTEATRQSIKDK